MWHFTYTTHYKKYQKQTCVSSAFYIQTYDTYIYFYIYGRMNAAAVAQFEVEPRRAGLAARKGRALVCPSTKMGAHKCPLCALCGGHLCALSPQPRPGVSQPTMSQLHMRVSVMHQLHCTSTMAMTTSALGRYRSGRPKNLNGWRSCLEVPVLPVQHPALRIKTNWSPENLRDSLPSSTQQCWVMADCVQQLASKQVAVAACTRNLK